MENYLRFNNQNWYTVTQDDSQTSVCMNGMRYFLAPKSILIPGETTIYAVDRLKMLKENTNSNIDCMGNMKLDTFNKYEVYGYIPTVDAYICSFETYNNFVTAPNGETTTSFGFFTVPRSDAKIIDWGGGRIDNELKSKYSVYSQAEYWRPSVHD